MGRRKGKRLVANNVKRYKVDKVFDCPLCSHEKVVEVTLQKGVAVADIRCRVCHIHYSSPRGDLSEPIDVYSEWMDQLEADVEQEKRSLKIVVPAATVKRSKVAEDPEMEDDLLHDDLLDEPLL